MVGIVPVLENWRDPNSLPFFFTKKNHGRLFHAVFHAVFHPNLTAQSLDVGQLAGQSHKVATVPERNVSKPSFVLVVFSKLYHENLRISTTICEAFLITAKFATPRAKSCTCKSCRGHRSLLQTIHCCAGPHQRIDP